MLSKIYTLIATLLTSSALASAADIEPMPFKITQFLDPKDSSSVVVISAGSKQGIVDGALFKSYRPGHSNSTLQVSKTDVLVETGKLKAFKVESHFTLAQVVEPSTPMAKALFPKFPGVMAGDMVKEINSPISTVQDITPESTVRYHDLFIDPKREPNSFELSERGRQKLRELAMAYARSRAGTLKVSGYTDHNGEASVNQVESYQRALTVRQFLISDLGFDKDRVVAIGFGEAEPEIQGFTPSYRRVNRRITLKIIP